LIYCNFICTDCLVLSWCCMPSYLEGSCRPPLNFFFDLFPLQIIGIFFYCFLFYSWRHFLCLAPKHTRSQSSLRLQSCFFFSGHASPRNSHFLFISLVIMLMSLHAWTNLVVRFFCDPRTEGGTHIKTEDWSYLNLVSHVPAGLRKLCLWEGVFLMSSEIFQSRNPGKLYLIL